MPVKSFMIKKILYLLGGAFILFLSSCIPSAPGKMIEPTPSDLPSSSVVTVTRPILTPSPLPTQAVILASATSIPTRIEITSTETPYPQFKVCSPLEDVTLEEIGDLVTNPFAPPRLGFDDGHQGVDFSFYRHGQWVGMQGLPVHAMLPGKVISVVKNRPPYGFMVISETEGSSLPAGSLIRSYLPNPIP